ncbi:hypothetical protein GJ496_004607 [Pomphorhynchus laevis]|nr:hypothetical protein GJ496_004607 [Pomphorhynchus laevis]
MLLQNLSDSISGESINQKINSIVNVDDVSVKVTLGNQETPFNLEDPSHRGGMQYKQYRYTDTVHTPSPSITDSSDIHIKDLTSETSDCLFGDFNDPTGHWIKSIANKWEYMTVAYTPPLTFHCLTRDIHSYLDAVIHRALQTCVKCLQIHRQFDSTRTPSFLKTAKHFKIPICFKNLGRKFTGEHDTSGNYKRIRNTFDGVNQIVAIGRKQSKQIERD